MHCSWRWAFEVAKQQFLLLVVPESNKGFQTLSYKQIFDPKSKLGYLVTLNAMSEKVPKDPPQQTYGWSQYSKLRKMEEVGPKSVPEPFTVPEGYKPESLKELWQYVWSPSTCKHVQPIRQSQCSALPRF